MIREYSALTITCGVRRTDDGSDVGMAAVDVDAVDSVSITAIKAQTSSASGDSELDEGDLSTPLSHLDRSLLSLKPRSRDCLLPF